MQPHEERVIAEELELSAKLDRLEDFVHGPMFVPLPVEDRKLLIEQTAAMALYADVLKRRIARFDGSGV
jgi:hypothetical protein